MSFPQQWAQADSAPWAKVNENLDALAHQAVYAKDPTTSSALTWGYQGGRWGGFSVADGTLTLTDASSNYIVVLKSNGVISTSTTNTNWNNSTDYARVYLVTTSGGAVTAVQDHRAGPGGVHGGVGASSGGTTTCIPVACGDETTAITTGTAKVTFRMPFAFTLTAVRASVTTAPTGANLVIDINEGGTTILSTKLSIDATEKTSTTAATPAVISDTALADDAEITIDFDQVGSTIAGAGVKVYLIGTV
jgi:hypothetical protein